MISRILHVDTGREMRGGQRQVLLLLKGLRSAGLECSLLARPDAPLFHSAASAGFAVSPAGWRPLLDHSRRADLVHAHDARAHTYAALLSRVPFVVSRRVAFPLKRSLLSQLKYRRAARYLAVSQFVASALAAAQVPKEKIDVVYDGVDPALEPAVWQPAGPIVAPASADPAKGRALLAQAAQLARLNVKYSADLAADLPGASLFVYLTRSEGFGSAVLLAMALGIPVIASDTGGLREALRGGEAGLLVPNDPPKIAEAIRSLRDDLAFAQTLIRGGRETVAQYFSAQQMVERTILSYRRALAV